MDPEVARVAAGGPPQDRRSPIDVAAAELELTCQQQEPGRGLVFQLGIIGHAAELGSRVVAVAAELRPKGVTPWVGITASRNSHQSPPGRLGSGRRSTDECPIIDVSSEFDRVSSGRQPLARLIGPGRIEVEPGLAEGFRIGGVRPLQARVCDPAAAGPDLFELLQQDPIDLDLARLLRGG
jgi:hypothetical protein